MTACFLLSAVPLWVSVTIATGIAAWWRQGHLKRTFPQTSTVNNILITCFRSFIGRSLFRCLFDALLRIFSNNPFISALVHSSLRTRFSVLVDLLPLPRLSFCIDYICRVCCLFWSLLTSYTSKSFFCFLNFFSQSVWMTQTWLVGNFFILWPVKPSWLHHPHSTNIFIKLEQI